MAVEGDLPNPTRETLSDLPTRPLSQQDIHYIGPADANGYALNILPEGAKGLDAEEIFPLSGVEDLSDEREITSIVVLSQAFGGYRLVFDGDREVWTVETASEWEYGDVGSMADTFRELSEGQ